VLRSRPGGRRRPGRDHGRQAGGRVTENLSPLMRLNEYVDAPHTAHWLDLLTGTLA